MTYGGVHHIHKRMHGCREHPLHVQPPGSFSRGDEPLVTLDVFHAHVAGRTEASRHYTLRTHLAAVPAGGYSTPDGPRDGS